MAGLVPAIYALLARAAEKKERKKDVDARDKRGHDESRVLSKLSYFAIEPRSLARSLRRLRQDSPKIGRSK
jgi:hypothetical protein